MTYKELQSALKSAKAQGLTNVKLNAKKDVLQAEYDRLNAIEIDEDYGEDEEEYVDPETSRTNIDEPLVKPEPTRREILAKIIAEAPESVINEMWAKFMNEPAPEPAPEVTPEPAPEVTPEPAPVTDEQVLETIKELDTELGTENYLEIYHLRNSYPQVKRLDMDAILYRLQKSNRIDFSTLQEVSAYTPEQIDAGIPQIIGGQLFFLMVNN